MENIATIIPVQKEVRLREPVDIRHLKARDLRAWHAARVLRASPAGGKNAAFGQLYAQGVQIHAAHDSAVLGLPVFGVAQHGMSQACQLHSNLMGPGP